jgi:hypothetical protein
MSKKPLTKKAEAEKVVKDIRRATRKIHSAEEKIRIVLAGLRGEDSIAELCRREGIALRGVAPPLGPTRLGNLAYLFISHVYQGSNLQTKICHRLET